MEKLRPNEQRAKIAILLIWIVLALEIVNLISNYLQYDLLQTIANGGFISDEAAEANDTRVQILAILYLIPFAISAVTFIMWFRRAYFNLHQKVSTLQFSEGWAAGSWFVPILCLYRPYQIMKELYVETKEFFSKKGQSEKIDYSTNYLSWWWAFWLISAFIGNISLRLFLKSDGTLDSFITETIADMVLNVLGIPLALITVKVIRDYSKVEPLLAQISDDEPKIDNAENLNCLSNTE